MAVTEPIASPADPAPVAERDAETRALEAEISTIRQWMDGDRFSETTRLHTARQVAEQRGRITADYPIARAAADSMYAKLRALFAERRSITTFGPYTPGHAVAMKRAGIEAIYLGGWATSAKGSADEDPGPDLASYPLGQVPDEAAGLVRALLTADRNQRFARSRMAEKERQAVPEVDFSPWIIADADTGHGGDAHVRNLIRRFVEAGVPGYHIEDQKPGAKKCGHQGGKVLVPSDEQIKRLNAARFQLDVMGVAGILVARTDAEAANLLDGIGDERDQPFLLGVTNREVPSYKVGYLALLRRLIGPARRTSTATSCTPSPRTTTPRPRPGSSGLACSPRSTRPAGPTRRIRAPTPRTRSTTWLIGSSPSGSRGPTSKPTARPSPTRWRSERTRGSSWR